METPIRVILADDHRMFREGIMAILKSDARIQVIGEAANGTELIKLARDLEPDVIVTDINMPGMNGIEAASQLTKILPATAIIAMSMHSEDSYIVAMLRAGALGYLEKNAAGEEIIYAIKTVNNKEPYYCDGITRKLHANKSWNRIKGCFGKIKQQLSRQETMVAVQMGRGLSDKEIAAGMQINVRTVHKYKERIMQKIHAERSVEIAFYAIKNHLVIN